MTSRETRRGKPRAGRSVPRTLLSCLAALGVALTAACEWETDRLRTTELRAIPGADPERGAILARDYGCNTCHTIPGVRSARGTVGPPLDGIANRTFLAGVLPNTADNMILWIRDPQGVQPGNAMPDLGVTEIDARDIAGYLLTLDSRRRVF